MLRWLLPMVAVLALFGQAVTSYAATGTFREGHCCCPVKKACKCDHDGKPLPTMKRCDGIAKLVAPSPAVAIAESAFVIAVEARVVIAPTVTFEPVPDDVSREPEKPPF